MPHCGGLLAGPPSCWPSCLTFHSCAILFHFSQLHATDILLCVAAGVVSIAWFELLKVLKNQTDLTIQGDDPCESSINTRRIVGPEC